MNSDNNMMKSNIDELIKKERDLKGIGTLISILNAAFCILTAIVTFF